MILSQLRGLRDLILTAEKHVDPTKKKPRIDDFGYIHVLIPGFVGLPPLTRLLPDYFTNINTFCFF